MPERGFTWNIRSHPPAEPTDRPFALIAIAAASGTAHAKQPALTAPLTLAACLPAPYGLYYRPSYPDPAATATQASCGGRAGPRTRLRIPGPESLTIQVTANQHEEHKVSVQITLPALARFRFTDRRIADHSPAASPVAATVRVTSEVSVPAHLTLDPATLAPTDADSLAAHLAAHPGDTVARVDFPMGRLPRFAPPELIVEPPVAAGLPPAHPAHLRPEACAAFPQYRAPAYAADLAAKAASCRQATPERRCDNIFRYDPYAYQRDDGEHVYRGRFWLVGSVPTQDLHHNLEILIRTARPWRLANPVLVLRDAENGAERRIPFPQLTLGWDYPMPLDARVHVRGGLSDPPTRITLALVFTHRDASRYRIQLPPFELNGRRHQLQPIDFERRLFDGGLEPFNC